MYRLKRFFYMGFAVFLLLSCGMDPLTAADNEVQFTQEERSFIEKTQNGSPVMMGVIPNIFPLSSCPPETEDFSGLNVEMLRLISEKSGLEFEFCRIPIEEMTPYNFLQIGGSTLVSGTIRLDRYAYDTGLILSERLSDGAAICVANRKTDLSELKNGSVSMIHGYQAGLDFMSRDFPGFEIKFCADNTETVDAVRKGETDVAIISRYVGEYELQKPRNSSLMVVPDYEFELDSCIMGIRTPETELIVSIINKSLELIPANEYNHAQMNFIVEHPYDLTFADFVYKYRYSLEIGGLLLGCAAYGYVKLAQSKKAQKLLSIDGLTGAYTEPGFDLVVQKALTNPRYPLYIVDFDIENFHVYNELYGQEAGDTLLKKIVQSIRPFLADSDFICRVYADHFKVLYTRESMEVLIENIQTTDQDFVRMAKSLIQTRYGIYQITDNSVPVKQIFSYATQAKRSAHPVFNCNIGVFNEALYQRDIKDNRLLAEFEQAITSKAFLPHYQPKFDAQTKKISGAEILARWGKEDGSLRFPGEFVELLEKSGQIRRLDFYMLEQVCALQRSLLDQGVTPVAISVNFSPIHLYNTQLVQAIDALVERYGVPKNLIEIEWTETAMANSNPDSEQLFDALRQQGYLIAMDDFGKAYSSLNMLSNMPLDVIKLDSGFAAQITRPEEVQGKSREVVNHIISLAKTLSLRVVAEGVETQAQYEFLRDAGCHYIQGYYFSAPVGESRFVEMLIADGR